MWTPGICMEQRFPTRDRFVPRITLPRPMEIPSEIYAPEMLSGRAVLVTGGGTGLGRAAAAELVRCGASVAICGRRSDVLEATASDIGAEWVAGDVRDREDASRLVGFVVERFGRLDALVNNAGGQYFVPAEAIEPKG